MAGMSASKVWKEAGVHSDLKYRDWLTRRQERRIGLISLLPRKVCKFDWRMHMNRKKKLATATTVLFVLITALHVLAQAGNDKPGEWQAVEQAIGRSGQVQADGASKFGFPRSDLKVTVEGIELKPALALGGWVAFSKPGTGSMIMGDLVLTEDEVTPVMSSLENNGVQVTALHNHVLHESPRIMYMHIGGHGDAVKLATAVKEAVALT